MSKIPAPPSPEETAALVPGDALKALYARTWTDFVARAPEATRAESSGRARDRWVHFHAVLQWHATSRAGGALDTIVDVGCNDGIFWSVARAAGLPVSKVVGLDRDEDALARAAARDLEVHAVDIGADSFPLADASVDVTLVSCVLEHLRDPVHPLRECRRVLRPGGLLLVCTPNAVAWRHLQTMFQGHTPGMFTMGTKDASPHFHYHNWNYAGEFEAKVLVRVPGFTPVHKTGCMRDACFHAAETEPPSVLDAVTGLVRGVASTIAARASPNHYFEYMVLACRKE